MRLISRISVLCCLIILVCGIHAHAASFTTNSGYITNPYIGSLKQGDKWIFKGTVDGDPWWYVFDVESVSVQVGPSYIRSVQIAYWGQTRGAESTPNISATKYGFTREWFAQDNEGAVRQVGYDYYNGATRYLQQFSASQVFAGGYWNFLPATPSVGALGSYTWPDESSSEAYSINAVNQTVTLSTTTGKTYEKCVVSRWTNTDYWENITLAPGVGVIKDEGVVDGAYFVFERTNAPPTGALTFTNIAQPMGANLGVQSSSIQWGDYDGDGDLDLCVSGYDGTTAFRRLIIYRNDGAGSFTLVAQPMGSNVGVSSSSIQWGDYDNDGDLDIAVSGSDGTNKRLIIYRNNGGGSFGNPIEPMGANLGVTVSSIQWGDYDNDGDLDLAVSGQDGASTRRLIIYRNDGGGTFTSASEPMGANLGVQASAIQWGDYDGDGDIDLAVAGYDGTNPRLIIYRNDGGGAFTRAAEPMGAKAGISSGSIQWGDYDNDGDLDLAVSGFDGTNYRLIIYRNNGRGSFTPAFEPMGPNVGVGGYSSIQWGDYDNDGDVDLAVSGYDGANTRMIIYRNDGASNFLKVAEPMGTNTGLNASSIQWGDYDDDGDLDLAISGTNVFGSNAANRLLIFRSDGNTVGASGNNNYIKVNVKTDANGNAVESDAESDRDAIAAKVVVKSTSGAVISSATMGNPVILNIGVGSATSVDIDVTFPDGDIVSLTGQSVNTSITVKDPAHLASADVLCVPIGTSATQAGKYRLKWTPSTSGGYIRAFFRQSESSTWADSAEIRTTASVYKNASDREKNDGMLEWNSKIITYKEKDTLTALINCNVSVQIRVEEYDNNDNRVAIHTSAFITIDNSINSKKPIFLIHGINNVADDMNPRRESIFNRNTILDLVFAEKLPEADYDIWLFEYPRQQRWDYSAKLLKNAIQTFQSIVTTQKITLVAYSMGGLVSRWYLEKYDPDNTSSGLYISDSVDKLIMLNTPNRGASASDFGYHYCHFLTTSSDIKGQDYAGALSKKSGAVKLAVYKTMFSDYANLKFTTPKFDNEAALNLIIPATYYNDFNNNYNLVAKLNNWSSPNYTYAPVLRKGGALPGGDVEYGIIAGTKSFNLLDIPSQLVPQKYSGGPDENDMAVGVWEASLDDVSLVRGNYTHLDVPSDFFVVFPRDAMNTLIKWIKNPIPSPPAASEKKVAIEQQTVDATQTTIASLGSTQLQVPSGVVASNSKIEVSLLAADNPSTQNLNEAIAKTAKKPIDTKNVIDFKIKDSSGNAITTLGSSVRIQASYPDVDGDGIVDGTKYPVSSLKLAYLNESTNTLEQVSTTLDATNKVVYADVTHFSIYIIVSDSYSISDTALTVNIEGRGTDRSGIHIVVYDAGGDTLNEGYTDSGGAFVLDSIGDGTFTVKLKEARTLRMSGTMTVSGGKITNFTFSNSTLKGGDANDDNSINSIDLSILGSSYNGSSDLRGDFNGDTNVNSIDLSIMGGNYNGSGD